MNTYLLLTYLIFTLQKNQYPDHNNDSLKINLKITLIFSASIMCFYFFVYFGLL